MRCTASRLALLLAAMLTSACASRAALARAVPAPGVNAPAPTGGTSAPAPATPAAEPFPFEPDRELPAHSLKPSMAAAESLHSYDALHYRLDLDFPCLGTSLSGTCAITLRASAPLGTVTFDCVSLNVDAVTQQEAPAPFSVAGGQLTVTLPHALAAGESTVVTVTYHGPAARGYYQAYPETWFTFTEPSNARYWFPCYDQPWDKATSEIHATVPDTMFVASNGVQIAPPDWNPVTRKKTYHWGTNFPVATYLVSVAIGNYAELADSAAYVPLRSYVLRADSAKAAVDFSRLPDMVDFYGSIWGQYPFENYGMAATKNFGGGMEHQTRTTISRGWITGTRSWERGYAHELSHQWWGDMVTCLSWPNVWLNEGFASYGDILFTEHAYGADSARTRLRAWAVAYFKEESTSSYSLYNPPSNKLFGLSIYYKGAWALHMLRHVMGDSAFVRGWRDFGAAHRYAGATVADFQAAMEARYGGPLNWFFDPWIHGKGHPVLRVSRNTVPRVTGGYFNYVTLEQVQPGGGVFRMPVELGLRAGGRDTVVTVWIGQDGSATSTSQCTLEWPVDSVTVDPAGWLLFQQAPSGAISDTGPGGGAARTLRFTRSQTAGGVVELTFEVPAALSGRPAVLEVFDVQGRRAAVLWRGPAEPGRFRARWSGAVGEGAGVLGAGRAPSGPSAAGVYFARISAGGEAAAAKLLWMK
ncbi:MAG: M1 family metallopeptidase [Candidatus Eisenbacteria bacterium]|nr:M1 family metallopeptidase [Candidatus Eisenbacteria bacterium]